MPEGTAHATAEILVDALVREAAQQTDETGAIRQWYPWMRDALHIVLCVPGYPARGLSSVFTALLEQNDSVTQEAMRVFPLRLASDAFLSGVLRTVMAPLVGKDVLHHIRKAVVPEELWGQVRDLASLEGRAMWHKLDWKTRCAFSRILVDALTKELRAQMENSGEISHWQAWMSEALVSITALNSRSSTVSELLTHLLVQNPVTAAEVLTSFSLNRDHQGYGVYCGIGSCLITETCKQT